MDDSVPNATWFKGGGIRKPPYFRISVSSGMESSDYGNRIGENTLDGNRAKMHGEVPEGGRVSE
jgi:hypothetical protein